MGIVHLFKHDKDVAAEINHSLHHWKHGSYHTSLSSQHMYMYDVTENN